MKKLLAFALSFGLIVTVTGVFAETQTASATSVGASAASIANGEVGNRESPDGSGCNKYTGALYGHTSDCPAGLGRKSAAYQWCSDFATWVWKKAGAVTSALSPASGSFYSYGVKHGTWHPAGSYVPKPGDAVLYSLNTRTASAAHVGIVVSSGKQVPDVVQGNWGDANATHWGVRYDAGSRQATGYSHLTISGYVSPAVAGTSPPAPTTPSAYHTGRKVTIDSHATGGVSGHKGPSNSYSAGPTRARNSSLYIVCYVNGSSVRGPYNTTTMWDLADDGYYYTDAWLYTGTNSAAVRKCAPKTVKVDSHATGGVSGHRGPGNNYAAGPTRAKGASVKIFCYVTGASIRGPYNTTTIWDYSDDGYYYTDAWLYTGTNGAAVPHC